MVGIEGDDLQILHHGFAHHVHGCGRGGLGARLVHIHICLVHGSRNLEERLAGHAREIRRVAKGLRHAHRAQDAAEVERFGHLEKRKRHVHLGRGRQLVEPRAQVRSGKGFFQSRKPIDRLRQQHYHGELASLVRQLDHLKCAAVEVVVAARAVHHRRLDRLLRGKMKVVQLRVGLVERSEPCALEVDGVGEHQQRGRRDGAGPQQVLDLVVGLLSDPRVDGGTHAFGRLTEVDLAETGAVVGLDQVQVGRQEVCILLRPERVGHVQFVARVRAVHAGQQCAHGGMQPLRRQRVVKNARHLRRRLTVRSRVGHGEGCGDALRREEQIARLGAQLRVEFEREGIAAFHGFGLIGRVR